MTSVLAIDIGGTAIKLGLIGPRGRIVCRGALPFDRTLDFDGLVDCIHRTAMDLPDVDLAPPARIAIATPGYSLPTSGRLVDGAGNVPILKDRSIRTALSQRFGLPATVENDGIAAATGELLYGAGRSYRRFVLLTIGTGIGGAVVVDDVPLAGVDGEPPELGAMVVGTPRDGTDPFTLEACAAAPALVQAFNDAADRPVDSVEQLFAALHGGDRRAFEVVDRACRHVAQAFGTLVNALGLQACIIGGGVSGAGSILCERVRAHMPAFTWPLLMARVDVQISALGNDAGLLGVSAAAFRKPSRMRAPTSAPA